MKEVLIWIVKASAVVKMERETLEECEQNLYFKKGILLKGFLADCANFFSHYQFQWKRDDGAKGCSLFPLSHSRSPSVCCVLSATQALSLRSQQCTYSSF
jgi:hypothetical protein